MHAIVLAIFGSPSQAAAASRALHAMGIPRQRISVVARNHDEEGALAEQMDATPGAEVEDSRPAARLGELGAHLLAAIAIVMPGIGPIVADGPLAADLGEAAGHAAGGVASVLSSAGLNPERAEALQREVQAGGVLLAVHIPADADQVVTADRVRATFESSGGRDLEAVNWPE